MYGVVFSFITNLIRQIDNSVDADITKLLGTSDEAKQIRGEWFKLPKYQERMRFLVGYYERAGFLDEL